MKLGMPCVRGGFSLIEVLISITVLSLALLGLAAVFPAVVKQQQRASDSAQGDSASRSAQDFVGGLEFMNKPTDLSLFAPYLTGGGAERYVDNYARGWTSLLVDTRWSLASPRDADSPESGRRVTGKWEVPTITTGGGTAVLSMDKATGDLTIGKIATATDPNNAGFVRVKTSERLSPRPFSTGADPRFVWDIAARRTYSGRLNAGVLTPDLLHDGIEVAVFVRRIDSAIRLTGDTTLVQVLGDPASVPTGARRVPVAADAAGRPSNDGRGGDTPSYSPIWSVAFKRVKRTDVPTGESRYEPDLIDVTAPVVPTGTTADAATVAQYAGQIGQKLLGLSGTVFTVIDLVRDPTDGRTVTAVRVEPSLRRQDFTKDSELKDVPPVEVLMTPQVPAAVRTFRAQPKFMESIAGTGTIRS